MKVIKYSKENAMKWNDFLLEAKNQTFLFNRNFMDYHSDRFQDYSLMVYDNDILVSIIPGNIINNNEVISHQGLSYGAFIFREDEKLIKILEVIRTVLFFLKQNNIDTLYYKAIPRFYNTVGSDEIEYAMFILSAHLYRRDLALTIKSSNRIKYQTRRKRAIKKALKSNIIIKKDFKFDDFWVKILIPNLEERFGVAPVHSLDEISKLSNSFPESILQYNAYIGEEIIAGTTIFNFPTVAHAQYISASHFGRKSGGLDLLFDELISNTFNNKEYFDFGISNEENGRKINQGLLEWKEGFGGRSFSHDFYKIETKNWVNIEKVLNND